jgi:hypothetical protein
MRRSGVPTVGITTAGGVSDGPRPDRRRVQGAGRDADAVVDFFADPCLLEPVNPGGDPQFAFSLLHGLHEKLFAVEVG